LAACSPSSGGDANGPAHLAGAAAGSIGSNGMGGAASQGGNGNQVAPSAGGSFFGPIGMPPPPSPNTPDGSCGATLARAEHIVVPMEVQITEMVPQPVALYFMLDQSGSMVDMNKWGAAVTAINDFVNDPRSANIKVAMQMFSFNLLGNPPGCSACDGSDCKVPMVPMAPLPGAASGISTALNRVPIGIGTPIEAGLRGGVDFCSDYQKQNPNEKCVLVLITDGAPTTCAGDAPTLSGIASTAKMQDNVLTFTIGMSGADFTLLDAIAQAAGTDCTPNAMGETCDASNNSDFLTALETIRTSVAVTHTETRTEVQNKPVQCEFRRPDPPDGDMFDKTKVNVTYTAAGKTTKVGKANSVAECPPEGGWYYDNEDTPTKILVCPATCAAIQSAPDIDVSVLLGCASEPIVR
jgi:Mg-chelatase subunit ChlD